MAKLLTDAPARAGATLESPAEALPGLVFAFRLRPDGIAEELGVDRAIAVEPRGWLWLHFNLADRYSDDVAGKLDHIEERILADDVSEGRNMLRRIRRTTVRLHRQLVILRSLIQRFELDKLTTSKLRQRLDWLDIEVVSLRDRRQLLQERSHG